MATPYFVNPGWRLVLRDVGLSVVNVLRRAGLPDDLLALERAALLPEEYFGLWRALAVEFAMVGKRACESADAAVALRIGTSMSVEAFDPPVFAALCSENLDVALRRIAKYKRLIGPMVLDVRKRRDSTCVEIRWPTVQALPPAALVMMELVFFVHLARLATRVRVVPVEVAAPVPPVPAGEFRNFFGVSVRKGQLPRVVFRAEDAALPFLTANDAMWRFFEPELGRRLSELDESASMVDRTRGALLELLPCGESNLGAVCKRLGTSIRTLQRRLREQGTSYQAVLDDVRARLAQHYLASSELSHTEIAFLLGFGDPNSFFRAYHAWTGTTPSATRGQHRRGCRLDETTVAPTRRSAL